MEDQVEIVEYLSEIKNVSPRSSLVIAGASFYLQYKRTRSLPIDSTSTWNSLEKATRYAQNIDTVAYAPYDGQMITVKENGTLASTTDRSEVEANILVLDESLPLADKRVHCKLGLSHLNHSVMIVMHVKTSKILSRKALLPKRAATSKVG